MNTIKVTSSLILASLLFFFGCAGTEDDSANFRSNMTKEEAHEFLEQLAEERAFESIKDLEEVLEEMDLSHLEELVELEALHHLEDLEHHLEDLDLHHLADLEEHMAEMHERLGAIHVDVDIPPIPAIAPIAVLPDVPMPAIVPLPDINVPVIVDIDAPVPVDFGFHGFSSGGDMKRLFPGITDDEILKIQAMRSLTRQSTETAVPTLSKIAKKGKSAAQRYMAVTLLSRYLKKDRSIVPLLGEVALNDENVNVRKRAVVTLGKSKDSRAISILEEIIKKGGE